MQTNNRDNRDAMAGQLKLMSDQLAQMKSSGEQAERTIQAFNRIAGAAAESTAASNRLADAATQSVEVTRGLTDTASQANNISRQALIDVQRAFMFVRGVDLEKIPNSLSGDFTGPFPMIWLARVKWENSGNTPTKDLTISSNCLTSSEQTEDPYSISDPASPFYSLRKSENRFLFGPKQVNYAGACFLSPADIMLNQFAPTALRIFVFGTAKYRDAIGSNIGSNKIHRTDFCYHLRLTGNFEAGIRDVPGAAPLTINSYSCAKHNCADEECEKEDRDAAAPDPGPAK